VGDSNTPNGADHAVIYRNGTMTDLNTLIDPHSGWTLGTAFAINNKGEIVGVGTNASGQSDAFLLSSPNPVPEPPSVTLLGLGALCALGYARRRRKTAGDQPLTSMGISG
jgi:probable HAF family extracellular repeat protein